MAVDQKRFRIFRGGGDSIRDQITAELGGIVHDDVQARLEACTHNEGFTAAELPDSVLHGHGQSGNHRGNDASLNVVALNLIEDEHVPHQRGVFIACFYAVGRQTGGEKELACVGIQTTKHNIGVPNVYRNYHNASARSFA